MILLISPFVLPTLRSATHGAIQGGQARKSTPLTWGKISDNNDLYMKKLLEILKKLLGNKSSDNSSSGFTLIELLIVIAILGILAAGLLVAIDPLDKIRGGNDSKALSDARQIYDGALAAYVQHTSGLIPADLASIGTNGGLQSIPVPPNGYGSAYTYVLNTTSNTTATSFCVSTRVMSKAQVAKAVVQGLAATPANTFAWFANGKVCYGLAAITQANCAAPPTACQ